VSLHAGVFVLARRKKPDHYVKGEKKEEHQHVHLAAKSHFV
jgi:hypothetical protein